MSTVRDVRLPTLRSLASAIHREHNAALLGVRTGITHAHRCGVLLLEAKKRCGHGKWLSLLECHCPDISQRSAQVYMTLARRPEKELESIRSIKDALSLLSEPPDLTQDSNTQSAAHFCVDILTPKRPAERIDVEVRTAPLPRLAPCVDNDAHEEGYAAETERVLKAIDTLSAVNDRAWYVHLTAAQRNHVRKVSPQLYEFARWLHFDSGADA